MNKDAKGKSIPSWVRYIDVVTGSYSGYSEHGLAVPFGIYCSTTTAITFKPVDNGADVTFSLGAGYHPIEVESITSIDNNVLALFAYRPKNAIS